MKHAISIKILNSGWYIGTIQGIEGKVKCLTYEGAVAAAREKRVQHYATQPLERI